MKEFLPKPVRVVTLCVSVAMAFGLGIFVAHAEPWGGFSLVIAAAFLLFGSVYGFVLYTYIVYCLWKNRKPKM